jgi:hypothetical protein
MSSGNKTKKEFTAKINSFSDIPQSYIVFIVPQLEEKQSNEERRKRELLPWP